MIGFFQNQYKKVSDVSLPITSTTINRSYAAFEFFTLVNGKPFYLDRHLKRLYNTLKILRITIDFDEKQLHFIIQQLLDKNQHNDISYKIFVIPEPDNFYEIFHGDLFIFPVLNVSKEQIYPKTGAKLLLKAYQRFLPEAKTTNYTAYMYWEHEVLQKKAIDVLYFNNTTIRETSRSNIFIVKDEIIYTPLADVLMGVTRSITIDLIRKNKYRLVEKEISLEELFLADEVFITSTTREITPITQLENTLINELKIGKITQQLIRDLQVLKKQWS